MISGWGVFKNLLINACLIVFLFSLDPTQSNAVASEAFYKDKSIRLVVPFTPGGGTDIYARLVARHWRQHIAGNPSIIVQNMLGAGGTVGFNYLYHRAKPDGLTLGVASPGIVLRQLIKFEGARYDVLKMPLVASSGRTDVFFVRGGMGIKTVQDLQKLGRPVITGAPSRGSVSDAGLESALAAFGIGRKPIYGYPGEADVVAAMRRGELELAGTNVAMYGPVLRPLEEEGGLVVLFQLGLLAPTGEIVRDRSIPHIRTVTEVYGDTIGKPLSGAPLDRLNVVAALRAFGTSIFLPPGVPKARISELRSAFMKMQQDPEFIAVSTKVLDLPDAARPGDEGESILKKVFDVPSSVMEFFK